MKYIVYIFLLFPILVTAQTYKYIGIENGLSNEGMDRYNGKDIKHYKLNKDDNSVASQIHLGWLYATPEAGLWVIGRKGRLFQYEKQYDRFTIGYKLPDISKTISYGYVDHNNNIWLCCNDSIVLYNIKNAHTFQFPNILHSNITAIEQIDDNHFFIATETGVRYAKLENGAYFHTQVSVLYFQQQQKKLYIGSFERGIFVYDMLSQEIIRPEADLSDVNITRIRPLNETELLVATEGMGVYKLDMNKCILERYISANYQSYNEMNGDNINDVFVDESKRIWLANYPTGITVIDYRYENYHWMKHSMGNKQSIVNDQVHAVIEDSDGDLWFGTSNGISLYNSGTGEWHSFLSSFDPDPQNKNHIFITLCEVTPGIIWAGGYSSGIHQINKGDLSVEYFAPSSFANLNIRSDKYIRTIIKDSQGSIWSGGYYNLKKIDLKTKSIQPYHGLNSITAIVEKDSTQIWIGTATGLFLLDKKSGSFERIKLPVESTYIYSLFQAYNGSLYIGTSGSGLLIYDPNTKLFTHYYTDNCALISNNIYTILSDQEQTVFISTENGLVSFNPQVKTFHNWTKEQGLMTIHFNAESGILRSNNNFIFGSSDGAVEFHKDMKIPRTYSSKMVFSDFSLFYQTLYPGDKNSPLKEDIDETHTLKLEYDQNIFSIKVSSINYDYPSNILYSYKMEGFYDEWSRPGNENIIRFTNLSPGEYMLRVRAVSNEDKRIVLEEREMKVIIAQPIWLSLWALLFYTILIGLISAIVIRVIILRKQRKVSDEKIHFFINTAHDIRTPLTLIKAPLEELREKEQLSKDGIANTNTALRNVNALLRLTTNLINFERADVYSSELYISEYELNTYMEETFNAFRPYATVKHINFTYESNFRYLNVWFDKEKMDSILKNIISNALKYTPESGSVHVFVSENEDTWSVEVKDTGIGIPANEQKKLFKIHFRGSNAINSKVTGSGIGLMLVWKLVHLHKGKIHLNSIEHQGSIIKVSFPKDNKQFKKAHLTVKSREKKEDEQGIYSNSSPEIYENAQSVYNENRQRLLIVEDNDELRNYLGHTLSETYTIQMCSNGKEALTIVKEYKPELIISDIMMPEMRGDELCAAIKNDIETSHIPIILLTALNDEKNILEGLKIGADEYVVKPFNIGILKATITNLLTNRALLRNKYANLELSDNEEEEECINCSKDIDWKFIATVKKSVEDNMDNQAFNVDVLCTLLNMSRTSFYNKIKALTDQAPADYIRLIRLKRAAHLLKTEKYTITEVAEMTGFNDAKYFREVFKRHFKVSPSRYMKGEDNKNTKEEEEEY